MQPGFPEIIRLLEENLSAITKRLIELHDRLGEGGKAFSAINEFGDRAVVLDVESEELVINSLVGLKLPRMIIRSEEHGILEIGNGDTPVATLYLDGIDGSDAYRNNTGNGYGTLLAIAPGDDPTYDGVALSCLIMPDRRAMICRVRGDYPTYRTMGQPAKLILPGRSQPLRWSSLIFVDNCSDLVSSRATRALAAAGYENLQYTKTTSGNLYRVLAESGIAIIEEIDKGAIEMPAMFHLIHGIGGAMLNLDGLCLDGQRINTFGVGGGKIFVMARSRQIAMYLIKDINRTTTI